MSSSANDDSFTIILVSYNSADVIREAISSIPTGNQVIVVDNASADKSIEISQQLGADIIALGTNVGFGTACNRGAAIARQNKLLFLNPDARLEPETLNRLAAALDEDTNRGICAPRIIDSSGTVFFRKRSKLFTVWPWQRKPVPQESADIRNPSGAALAMRTKVFQEIGGFDENIFLYFEDDDLCYRVVEAGYKIRYVYDAVVHHMVGKSTSPSAALAHFKEYHYYKSLRYVCRKHKRFYWRWYLIGRGWWKVAEARRHGDINREAAIRGMLKGLLE